MRHINNVCFLMMSCLPILSLGQSMDTNSIRPRTGQPAADVLASHDWWGNPTFIGSLTNKGTDSQSIW